MYTVKSITVKDAHRMLSPLQENWLCHRLICIEIDYVLQAPVHYGPITAAIHVHYILPTSENKRSMFGNVVKLAEACHPMLESGPNPTKQKQVEEILVDLGMRRYAIYFHNWLGDICGRQIWSYSCIYCSVIYSKPAASHTWPSSLESMSQIHMRAYQNLYSRNRSVMYVADLALSWTDWRSKPCIFSEQRSAVFNNIFGLHCLQRPMSLMRLIMFISVCALRLSLDLTPHHRIVWRRNELRGQIESLTKASSENVKGTLDSDDLLRLSSYMVAKSHVMDKLMLISRLIINDSYGQRESRFSNLAALDDPARDVNEDEVTWFHQYAPPCLAYACNSLWAAFVLLCGVNLLVHRDFDSWLGRDFIVRMTQRRHRLRTGVSALL